MILSQSSSVGKFNEQQEKNLPPLKSRQFLRSCGGMYTANTVASAGEALASPGSILAVSSRKEIDCFTSKCWFN